MLKKMVEKTNLITFIFAGVLSVLWLLYLILGSGEDKIKILVLTPVLPFILYGFVRLIFKVVRMNAPLKAILFFVYFFLIVGTLGILMMSVEFISGFPNALSPTLGGSMGLIVAVLAEAKKSIEKSEK